MNNIKRIVVLKGDGIGPEVISQSILLLYELKKIYKLNFELEFLPIGGSCYDLHKKPLTDDTIAKCLTADAIILGSVGGPKWDGLPFELRPERALLKLRKSLDLYANLRPIKVLDELADASSLKSHIIKNVDLLIIRELTGDLYFGEPRGIKTDDNIRTGINTMSYNEIEIKRIAHYAFEMALKRDKKICSVDKENVLETSKLWRENVNELSKSFPDISLNHMYVDNAAMQLVINPSQFDCILTSNMFGDILSDLAASLTGSIGMLPSASVGPSCIMYEPIHGSAPEIAGKDIANPLASFLCIGMMLDLTFNLPQASKQIEKTLKRTLNHYRTIDIWEKGKIKASCSEMGKAFINNLTL